MGLVLLWFLWRFGKNWDGGAMSKGRDKETCTVSFTEMGASLQRRQSGDLERGLENLVGGDSRVSSISGATRSNSRVYDVTRKI